MLSAAASERTTIPRLIRKAAAGAIGLAAVGGLVAFAARPGRPTRRAPWVRCTP